MNINKLFSLLTVCLLSSVLFAIPGGRTTVKIAVMNYEPIMENRGSVPYWQACGWTDPRSIMPMIIKGWKDATDNAVLFEVVHWTNIDLYPYHDSTDNYGNHRWTDETFWDAKSKGWPSGSDIKISQPGYAMAITNDFPHIPGMIDSGEIDHCVMFGGPYFGYWETMMIGKGAYWCNSSPIQGITEKLFVINGPSVERPGNTLHNYAHGLGESGLGSWFASSTISTIGSDTYRNPGASVNDFVKFTRCKQSTNSFYPYINCGTCHMPPNGDLDGGWGYDYNDHSPVPCYADQWLDFPNNTNAPMRMVSCSDWNCGGDERYQEWWWGHIPRYKGLSKGRINNWLSYVLNPMKASYPIGSDQPLIMDDVDLRGWYTYEIYAPPGTTQITVRATTGTNVYFGLRKDLVPYRYRYGTTGGYDDWAGRSDSYERIINADNNYGRGVTGTWYLTFGKKIGYSTWNDWTYQATVDVNILPKPTNSTVEISIIHPAVGEVFDINNGETSNIVWSVNGIPQGVRSFSIAYQLTNNASEWNSISADFRCNLTSPYKWFLPTGVASANARVRIITEDVYSIPYTNYSSSFYLNIPEPAGIIFFIACVLRMFIKFGR